MMEDLKQKINQLKKQKFSNAITFNNYLNELKIKDTSKRQLFELAEITQIHINVNKIVTLNQNHFTKMQLKSIYELNGSSYIHKWQLHQALIDKNSLWKYRPNNSHINKKHNKILDNKLNRLYNAFQEISQ